MLPTKVVCNSNIGFTLRNISVVRIEGLAFVSCAKSGIVHYSFPTLHATYYRLHLESVQMAEIIDCTFQDSYGSALGVVNSHLVLRENRFLNNCRLCSNGKCDNNFQGPRCYGGGVFVRRSNLSITGSSRFSGNSANSGGGVYAYSSNVYISENTTFSGNSAGRYGSGGGVYAHSSNMDISGNTTFSGNSANSGGGVSAYSSNVNISGNTTFSSNSASKDGGGVYADSSNVYISENTTFSCNSANYNGGGVYAMDSSNVDISGNTTFSGNSADSGGGVYT